MRHVKYGFASVARYSISDCRGNPRDVKCRWNPWAGGVTSSFFLHKTVVFRGDRHVVSTSLRVNVTSYSASTRHVVVDLLILVPDVLVNFDG